MKYENFKQVYEICRAIEQETKFLEQLADPNIAVTLSAHGKELVKIWPEQAGTAPADYGEIAHNFLNGMRDKARAIIAGLRAELEAL